MDSVNFKREITAPFTQVVERTEAALKNGGFGVLTRIEFDAKIREKLGKDLPRTLILGACNPALAYEAFTRNRDVTSLLPCNVVVRQVDQNKVVIEVAKPTALMRILNEPELVRLAQAADDQLQRILDTI